MLRRLVVIGLFCLLASLVASAALAAAPVRVLAPPVFSVLPFYWMEETGALPDVKLEIALSPDHARNLNLAATGRGEFLVTGLNVGAKGYVKGMSLQLVNVSAWALDYVVARDPEVKGWADLIGKRVNLPLQGGPLDFLVQFLIAREGLQAEQFEFVYAPVPQAVQLFNMGQLDAVVLPEPQVTQLLQVNPQAVLAIDIQKEWAKWHKGEESIPYVGLFIHQGWAEQNKALAARVVQAYNRGIDWMNANPQAAAKLGARVMGLPEAVILQALSRTRLAVYDRARTKALVHEHLEEMMEFEPDLVGGELPDDGFYY
jgi:NitT/TauT family transport system substrate-binding protein